MEGLGPRFLPGGAEGEAGQGSRSQGLILAKPTITLPSHEFFYTLDQVALLLAVEESWLRERVYFAGRMPDTHLRDKITAINLAEANERPRWRIPQRELVRWIARKGYKVL
jgi:hypothetical protein